MLSVHHRASNVSATRSIAVKGTSHVLARRSIVRNSRSAFQTCSATAARAPKMSQHKQASIVSAAQTRSNAGHPSGTASQLLLSYDHDLFTEKRDDFYVADLKDSCARLDHAHQMWNLVLGTITTRSPS